MVRHLSRGVCGASASFRSISSIAVPGAPMVFTRTVEGVSPSTRRLISSRRYLFPLELVTSAVRSLFRRNGARGSAQSSTSSELSTGRRIQERSASARSAVTTSPNLDATRSSATPHVPTGIAIGNVPRSRDAMYSRSSTDSPLRRMTPFWNLRLVYARSVGLTKSEGSESTWRSTTATTTDTSEGFSVATATAAWVRSDMTKSYSPPQLAI